MNPTPFYQDDAVTLYCGDARSIVPLLSPVDAIVTDPPYNETSLDWDVWPAGWPSLLLPITRQMWCFGSFRMFWEQRDEFKGWKLAQDVVWEKHNGSGLANDRFRRVHEYAVHLQQDDGEPHYLASHFYQGDWASLHKEPVTVAASERRPEILRRGSKPKQFGGIEQGTGYERGRPRLMRSVIPVASCHGYATNETQKPEGIVAPLVQYSVPPGGVVLDPFVGSGTTLAVARAQGKRSIGIEKRETQCRSIVERLKTSLALNFTTEGSAR